MSKLRITKPIAVVDCNFIQRCRGGEDDVPAGLDCLLTAGVFAELAMKDVHERDFLFKRFTAWTRRNADRLWMARDLIQVRDKMEPSPDRVRRIRAHDLISPPHTRIIREVARDSEVYWQAPLEIPAVKEWLTDAEAGRAAFVSFADDCRDFIAAQAGRPSEKIPHTHDAIRNYVRQYNVANLVIHRSGQGRYGDWRWRRHLERFPDRLLIAKRARLDFYFALRRSLGDSRKFENNWDDIHYAISASYTGHLATHDAGLARAAEILAPGLRIYSITGAPPQTPPITSAPM
jgi:hypothetical protein